MVSWGEANVRQKIQTNITATLSLAYLIFKKKPQQGWTLKTGKKRKVKLNLPCVMDIKNRKEKKDKVQYTMYHRQKKKKRKVIKVQFPSAIQQQVSD
jgi:hypothetical protein